MIGCPGKVDVLDSSGTDDGIGEGYDRYYPDHLKKVWIIEADCATCTRVREWWEALRANPGTYQLIGSNCATKAFESLTSSGIDLEITMPRSDGEPGKETIAPYRPDNIDQIMDHNVDDRSAAGGGSMTVHPRTDVKAVR